MKKKVFNLLFISTLGFSQTTKNVGDFNKITSFDQIEVLLIPGKENKVVLTGKNSDQVELVNKKGELKLRMPLTQLLKGDEISATVYYKTLDAVEANEGSSISSEAVFKSTMFDIIAKEGSQVQLKLDVSKLTARVANGSKITLEGTASNQDVLVNSGGEYLAKKLLSSQTVITANAGGISEVNAKDLVDAKVRAGGEITIYGKPKQINQKVIAGGTIQEAK